MVEESTQSSHRDPDGSAGEEVRLRISDPAFMRALAHPARLAVMDQLGGAARTGTATELAAVAGLSPSAMSYHLRALAKLGLIEEAPGEGDGRERRWQAARAIRGGMEINAGDDAAPDALAAERDLIAAWLTTEDLHLWNWQASRADEPPDWREATAVVGMDVLVTSVELAELNRKVIELFHPYRARARTPAPADARRVSMHYRAVPVVPRSGDPPQ